MKFELNKVFLTHFLAHHMQIIQIIFLGVDIRFIFPCFSVDDFEEIFSSECVLVVSFYFGIYSMFFLIGVWASFNISIRIRVRQQ